MSKYTVSFVFGMAFILGMWTYHLQAPNKWNCRNNHEVVTVDNNCVNINQLERI